MTELEKLQRAKSYMDQLAQGIDPINKGEIPEDSILNDVHIVRCFFYVSNVLEQVISNGGFDGCQAKRLPFSITTEQLSRVKISKEPVRIKKLAELISNAVVNPNMKSLSTVVITDWLLKKGFLEKRQGLSGENCRLPTSCGLRLGLFTKTIRGRDGLYEAVFYNAEAQRFIVDNITAILSER